MSKNLILQCLEYQGLDRAHTADLVAARSTLTGEHLADHVGT